MTDHAWHVDPSVRRNMQANRRRDTRPELALRSLLHARGLRFRVDQPLSFDRRRRADLTFPRVALYVFVDGCFWHGCETHFVLPKTRTEYWSSKVQGNKSRDLDTTLRLESLGGTVLRFWEHEDPRRASDLVQNVYMNFRESAHRGPDSDVE